MDKENMLQVFKAGDRIGGYCNGAFGRDDYDNKTCVMVTPNYAVFENEDGDGTVLNYGDFVVEYANGENWKWEL